MFYQNFIYLCERDGLAKSNVCKKLGLSENAWKRWENNSTPRPVSTEEIKTVLAAYKDLSPSGKKAFWSRVLTKIVPIPETGEFLLLYTNGNITDDILSYVHKRLF